MVRLGHGFALAVLVTSVLASSVARAAPSEDASRKKACVDAATQGQIQRDDGKLGAAAEAFKVCAESVCPAAVRRSCAEWLEDVRARRPSVTIEVTGDRGATHVEIDGRSAPAGAPLELDPGPHVARITSGKEAPFEMPFVLAEREKRTIAAERPAVPASPARVAPERPVPLSVWILGGVSVASVASFATFGLVARTETDRLTEQCAPVCTSDERSGALRSAVVADVSLGVAVAAAALAGVLYVLRPSRPTTAAHGAGFAF